MDLMESLTTRRSVRTFQPLEPSHEALQQILSAANSAPSAGDLQSYDVVVVTNPKRRRLLSEAAYEQHFVAQAPVVLVFLTDPERSRAKYGERSRLYACQDASIAAAYAQLAAHALGLSSVWVGAFDEDAVRRAVSAPVHLRAACVLPIGYAAETPPPTPRRALSDLVRRESYSGGDPW